MTVEAHSGDRAWIRSALERYEGRLLRYASRLTGDVERARDIVQEAFLRLCAAEESHVRDRLPEWLFAVCRNRVIDVERKESRMKPLPQGTAEARASREPDPSARVEGGEMRSRVVRFLEGLPWKQQEVIRLKFQEGMSYDEISRVTKLSVANVGYHLHTGLRTLRHRLGTGGATPGGPGGAVR